MCGGIIQITTATILSNKKFFPALDDEEEEEEEKYIQEIIKKWERIEEKSLTPNIRVEWPAFSPYAATQYLSLFTWK